MQCLLNGISYKYYIDVWPGTQPKYGCELKCPTDEMHRIGLDVPRDNGLKLFLEREDMERLYDFEEECVEGYFRESQIALHQSTEECIKTTNDRVENMTQKIEDINQKENLQSATVQVN